VAFKRFLQEARAAGGLNHPYVVTVYALKVVEPNVYMVMEYLVGGSMRTLLEQRSPLPVEEAVRIAADVCEGLAAAHAKGIVHRDVKPGNILLTEDGRAKVGDFGIAHVPRGAGGTSLTQVGFQPGTLIYMSPEQIRGQQVDGRSDVYQVGALLYEMLTGRHYVDMGALEERARETAGSNAALFQARLYELLSEAICEREPEGVCPLRPEVPEWAGEVVAAALAKRVEERPTAENLAKVLRSRETLHVSRSPGLASASVTTAEEHFRRGISLHEQRRFGDAVREFQSALHIDPNHTDAHCNLGMVYFELLRVDDAVHEFQTALHIDPGYAEAHCHLGKVYYMQGHLAEAIHECQAALHIRPDYAEAHASLGLVYGFQGRLDESPREYEAALSIKPNDAEMHYMLATIYARQGRPEAIRELQLAAQLGFEPARHGLAQIGSPRIPFEQQGDTRQNS